MLMLGATTAASPGRHSDTVRTSHTTVVLRRGGPPPQRPVTVADAITMVRSADEHRSRALAHYSPNGRVVAVILRRGRLTTNTNDFWVCLWRTADLVNAPQPEVVLRMSSSSNRDAIEDLTWLSDNETFVFLGERPGELHQLYAFNVRTRTLRPLTAHPTNIAAYSVTPSGDAIAYVADEPGTSIFDSTALRRGVPVSTQALGELFVDSARLDSRGLYVKVGTASARRIALQAEMQHWAKPFISPDGARVIVSVLARDVPTTWQEYAEPYISNMAKQALAHGQSSNLMEHLIVNVATDESKVLLNVPTSSIRSQIAWALDSRRVVVANTYLPLDGVPDSERRARESKTFSVEVDVSNGRTTYIAPGDLQLLGWDAGAGRVAFESADIWGLNHSSARRYYEKRDGRWVDVTRSAVVDAPADIVVEEDMNTPPRLVAVDARTRRRHLLLQLNPEFAGLRFGKVEEVAWTGSDGTEQKAGLYYPVDYVPGARYPLVVQTHEWQSDRFWIDGPYTTAFAAQPFAGRNIMVLQLPQLVTDNGPGEVDANLSMLTDAVTYLDRRGLIDRQRMGIIGFSYTCLSVDYALTHSNLPFRAASVTDGVDGGYWMYVASASSDPDYAREFELWNGGIPAGQGLSSWLARSPTFRAGQVEAPLLMTALNRWSLLGQWGWFALLARLGKPVEMLYVQDGTHELEKPWDRAISQDGNFDWFCFWLKGEEDPDPAKAEQYARWHVLRAMRDSTETRTATAPKSADSRRW